MKCDKCGEPHIWKGSMKDGGMAPSCLCGEKSIYYSPKFVIDPASDSPDFTTDVYYCTCDDCGTTFGVGRATYEQVAATGGYTCLPCTLKRNNP